MNLTLERLNLSKLRDYDYIKLQFLLHKQHSPSSLERPTT